MEAARIQPFPRRALAIAAACTAALGVVGVLLAFTPVHYAEVDVRWAPGTEATERQRVSEQLSLQQLRSEDDGETWVCILHDDSPANVRAILSHPAIASTALLDAGTLAPTERQEASALYWLGLAYPGLRPLRLARPLGLVPLFLFCLLVSLCALPAGRRWLLARVPEASPLSVGMFRIALALTLVPVVHRTVPSSVVLPYIWSPRELCFGLLVLFGAGCMARLAWVAFLAVFTAANWGNVPAHDFNLPLKALWLMAFVPWDDALSVRALVRRLRGLPLPNRASQRYGLATWIPIFMVGFAYLAAAFAKMDETGLRWITDGAVRYFMVVDAPNAPGSLGRTIASHEWLAVAVSGAAVVSEVFILSAAVWARPAITLAAGVCALLLHAGFWFTQGVFWYPWWALLPAFVPWEGIASWMRRRQWWPKLSAAARDASVGPVVPAAAGRATMPALCVAALGFFAIQQPLVSFLVLERLPYVSHYPMYSDVNWESKEDFARSMEAERQPAPAIRLEPMDGSGAEVLAERLQAIGAGDVVRDIARRLAGGDTLSDDDRRQLADVADGYQRRFGTPPPTVAISTGSWRFDWSVADFVPRNDWQRKAELTLGDVSRAG